MNKKISTKQLKYTICGFIIASSLLTSGLYYFARNDAWFSVLMGFVFSLVITGIYSALAKQHPGMSLTAINEAVFGRIPGKAVTVLYFFYFLSLSFLNTRDLGDFVKDMLLPATPLMVVFIIFISICALAVRKGPVKMTRYGLFLSLVSIIAILFNTILLLNKIDVRNLFPAITLPLQKYLIGAHLVTMLPFGEILAFMFYIPFMTKPDEIGKALKGGLLIGGVVLLFVVLRDITVLGGFTAILSTPAFSAIRMIDIGDVLTRLEVIYAVILMMMYFLKVSVVYYATVSCVRDVFGVKSHEIFIYIIGVLIVVYAMASFPAGAEHVLWKMTAAGTYSTFFVLVIPLVTLIVSVVRGGSQNSPRKTQEC